ncbi:MAG TPA: ATP-binding cassette domain-containing protein, partial [Chthonomonadaceae bacterium]|nr:ATP-binding cassette domain-containing protein [Chthonomonadaceae bacterium]
IFDEPTAVLAGDEVAELFTVLRHLRESGRTIILIAHKLAEILAVADRVTVLRLGERVASCTVAATNADQLAAWMMGSTLESLPAETEEGAGTQLPQDAAQSPPIGASHHFVADAIHVAGDRGEHTIRGVSLSVRGGEIFGIGGVDGNGQTALAEALVGLRVVTSGERTWNGGPFHPGSFPATAYIPQDRRQAGLAVTMTVGDNLLFDAVRSPDFRRGPLLKARPLRQLASNLIRMFDIRTPGLDYAVSALSGGNQQKIVVARALHANPEWIVAMNPTRGLDIHATRFVHTQLRQARARGAAIVVFSTDLDELFALSDRAAILSGGVLTEVASGSHKTTQIGLLLGGMEQKP